MKRRLVRTAFLLAVAGCAPFPTPRTTWHALVSPYAPGREVLRGYMLRPPRRGHEHDVVFRVEHPDGRHVEVHVVARGQWSGVRETRSFGVAWEVPRTRAPRDDAEAITAALHRALARNDPGALTVDAIPLEGSRSLTMRERTVLTLRPLGTRTPIPWALLAAALTLTVAWRRVLAARDALALGLVALGLRGALGLWGPFHINQQGSLWIEGSFRPDALRSYGPGFAELYGLFVHLAAPDRVLFVLNTLLGAMAAPLAMAVGARSQLTSVQALTLGVLVAVDPVLVRIAASESYITPLVTLALATAWTLLTAAQEDHPRRRMVLHLAGALFATQMVRIHPLGWIAVLLLPPIVFASKPLRAGATAVGLLAGATLTTSGTVLADVLVAMGNRGVVSPELHEVSMALGAMLGGLVALSKTTRRFALASALSGMGATVLWKTYGQNPVWRLAAVHVALLGPLLTVGASLPSRWPRALAVGLAVVALGLGAPVFGYQTTDQHEYRAARRWFASRAPTCRVTWVAFVGERRRAFLPAWVHRGATVPLDGRTPWHALSQLVPLGCTYYLRSTACETTDGASVCDAIERAMELVPESTVTLPAVASHRGLPYQGSMVRLRTFRVTALRP